MFQIGLDCSLQSNFDCNAVCKGKDGFKVLLNKQINLENINNSIYSNQLDKYEIKLINSQNENNDFRSYSVNF